MTPAISYLRVSSDCQVDGDGFPRQGTCTQNYADSHDYTVEAAFLERAICGANEMLDRPSMMDAIAFMAERGIVHILVEDFRRFARDLIVQELLIRDLAKAGIHVIDCTTNTDMTVHESKDPTAVLIRQILGALSQWERLTIVSRLRIARVRKKAATGICGGRQPYGYDKKKPDEYPVMLRMADMEESGMTQRDIATTLNDEGVPTRFGRPWTNKRVGQALKHHRRLKKYKNAPSPNGAHPEVANVGS